MRLPVAASLLFSLIVLPVAAGAQGGTLRGLVRDSAKSPVPDAEIIASPGRHLARTDSLGRFTITGIDGGQYTVRVRKLGYSPAELTAELHDNGLLDVTLTLEHRMANLDTVVVNADGSCPEQSLDGFYCRKKRGGKGVFMDYMDIDAIDAVSTADLFRDIPGFRIDTRPTRTGARRVPIATGLRCMVPLVNGRPATAASFVPDLPGDLVALEVYPTPAEVPKEYQQFAFPVGASERCGVAVYWDLYARLSSK